MIKDDGEEVFDLSNEDDIKRLEEDLRVSGEDYYTHGNGHIYSFEKKDEDDEIWWVDLYNIEGPMLFSFDKKVVYNAWADYPHKLTPEQKEVFDKENHYWADFFKDRPYKP